MGMKNSKLSATFKPYVGKVFQLRNRKTIVGSYYGFKDGSPRVELNRNEFGEAVFIVDESNTRVCCFNKNKQLIWIPKLYLLKEIISEKEVVKSVNEILNKMIHVYSTINESDMSKKDDIVQDCQYIIQQLKLLAEKHE